MSIVLVRGSGPVSYTDSSGRQWVIPLSALRFDDGSIDATRWTDLATLATDDQSAVTGWLNYLAEISSLKPGSLPKEPAMIIKAADPGAAGNTIQVTFSNITPDPSAPDDRDLTTFTVTITETNTYERLSIDSEAPNYFATVLGMGTDDNPGTRPGLVHVQDSSIPTTGAVLPAANSTILHLAIDGASKAFKAVNALDPTLARAFILEAKKSGNAGTLTTFTISTVNEENGTFNLEAVWTCEIESITPRGLPDALNEDNNASYEILVEAPDTGFDVPVAGTILLRGGEDRQAAKVSSVTVPTG